MKPLSIFSLWIALVIGALFLPQIRVSADAAAPYAEFNYEFQGTPIKIVSADLVLCGDATCAESQTGNYRRAHYSSCSETSCFFTVVESSPYRKLIVHFADQTRESGVFQQNRTYAVYTVTVSGTTLEVEEDRAAEATLDLGRFNETVGFAFPLALIITIAVDVVVAWVYCSVFKLPRRLVIWVAVLPIITLPVVWFGFLRLPLSPLPALLLAEGGVVLVEATFLYWRGQNTLSARHALFLSLAVNIASFALGLILFGA